MFLEQTFFLSDIPKLLVLASLEILLSADNAVVLGILSSALPPLLRKKALYFGFISAFLFRIAGILGISVLLQFPIIQALGAAYLIYLSINYFIRKRKHSSFLKKPTLNLWKTILLIEFFDLAFAVDSIIAGLAFINTSANHSTIHPKLWIVYAGGMIGVIAIRYAATFISEKTEKFPRLEKIGYAMIGWIGIKLALTTFPYQIPHFEFIFWLGLGSLFIIAFTKKSTHLRQ